MYEVYSRKITTNRSRESLLSPDILEHITASAYPHVDIKDVINIAKENPFQSINAGLINDSKNRSYTANYYVEPMVINVNIDYSDDVDTYGHNIDEFIINQKFVTPPAIINAKGTPDIGICGRLSFFQLNEYNNFVPHILADFFPNTYDDGALCLGEDPQDFINDHNKNPFTLQQIKNIVMKFFTIKANLDLGFDYRHAINTLTKLNLFYNQDDLIKLEPFERSDDYDSDEDEYYEGENGHVFNNQMSLLYFAQKNFIKYDLGKLDPTDEEILESGYRFWDHLMNDTIYTNAEQTAYKENIVDPFLSELHDTIIGFDYSQNYITFENKVSTIVYLNDTQSKLNIPLFNAKDPNNLDKEKIYKNIKSHIESDLFSEYNKIEPESSTIELGIKPFPGLETLPALTFNIKTH